MKRLDWYIALKYFTSFLFVSGVFLLIALVIDFTEKMGDFISEKVPVFEVLFYFLTVIPQLFAILAPLFLFVSVIWFTSKMASNAEVVSILGNGISYYRFLRPYIVSACILTVLFWFTNNWLVPQTNKYRVDFLNKYIHHMASNQSGINRTLEKTPNSETIASIQNFSFTTMEGFQFSLERYVDNRLVYQLRSPRISWKEHQQDHDMTRSEIWRICFHIFLKRIENKEFVYPLRMVPFRSVEERKYWEISNYEVWQPQRSDTNSIHTGRIMDTTLGFTPDQFVRRLELKETMTYSEIKAFIAEETQGGSKQVVFFEIEHYSRTSNAFAMIILTLIGVSFSSHRRRGGLGLNIAIGVGMSALFMLFLRFSTTFATNANLPAQLAVWVPNIIFGVIAYFSVRWAPK